MSVSRFLIVSALGEQAGEERGADSWWAERSPQRKVSIWRLHQPSAATREQVTPGQVDLLEIVS